MSEELSPCAWQKRRKWALPSDQAGSFDTWTQCPEREATNIFDRSPAHEYRPIYAHPDPRIAALEADLKTVLDREAATIARHDAKVDALEAEVVRLQSRSDVLEDLLETARIQVEQARREAEKADDEAVSLKVEMLRLRSVGSREDYALIKRFQKEAKDARAALQETPDAPL